MASTSPPLTSKANPQKLHPSSPEETIVGKQITLTPLRESHAEALYPLISGDANASLWTYMPSGPFHSLPDFQSYISHCASSSDPIFWAITSTTTGAVLGHTSHLNISIPNATIEIGHILYSPSLQRTLGATEAWFLLAKRAFEAGFRRLEWKCNAANGPSRRAAERLGHVFEGVFRQHMIVKGANRDTAWFSIVDGEWPACERAVERWMEEGNFDEGGRQRRRLEEVRGEDG